MKWLVYTGPHQEVEVPHDEVTGGYLIATRGVAVEVPDDVAESLLSQGQENVEQIPVDADGNPGRQPQHDCTWRSATTKETNAAQKAADPEAAAPAAAEGSTSKGGEQS